MAGQVRFADKWKVCTACKGTGQNPRGQEKSLPEQNICPTCQGEPYIRQEIRK